MAWDVHEQKIDEYFVTPGRQHDILAANEFLIEPGSTYVFDRAYNQLEFWVKIVRNKAHFVSRLKVYKTGRTDVKKSKFFPKKKGGVQWDGEWKPCKQVRRAKKNLLKGIRFRRIIYRDLENKRTFEFVSSNFRCSAQTIADNYKKRWSVELLFRWLKQHLDIRHLASKSENALSINLSIAVLIQLLLQIYKHKMKFKGSSTDCLKYIRNMFCIYGIKAMQFKSIPPIVDS